MTSAREVAPGAAPVIARSASDEAIQMRHCRSGLLRLRLAMTGRRRGRLHPTCASACARSAIRSSGCSMPMLSRMVPSVTPLRARTSAGTPEWVVRRRMADKQFRAAEADRQLEDAQRIQHAERLRLAAFDLDREGRAARRCTAPHRPGARRSPAAARSAHTRCGCADAGSQRRQPSRRSAPPASCAATASPASAPASSRNAGRAGCRWRRAAAAPA